MKVKVNIRIYALLFICSYSYGQPGQYNYKRELQGVTGPWHKIVLPAEVFGNVSPTLSDIRIFGVTATNDTIEVPYILQLTTEKIVSNEVNFELINHARNEKGYYFTFKVPAQKVINQIMLDFNQQNFDWRLTLEGSQNQQEWLTITEDYRIVSIKNQSTDYQFTKVIFPDSRYRFFRVRVNSHEKPDMTTAKITLHEITPAGYNDYAIKTIRINDKKQARQSEIDVSLESPLPVSYLKIGVKNSVDYYRHITIKYVTDSFKTEQGWKYNYRMLTSGTLTSIEKNEFTFSSTVLQKLKVVIDNQDNRPLTIDTLEVKGYIHELVARFTEPAAYFLTYGNGEAGKPRYDITHFADKIPATMTTLQLGDEQRIAKKELQETGPLFKNKHWLWGIMAVIILLLGGFSVKMIRKK